MVESIEIIPESIQLLKMTDEEYFSPLYKDYISNSKIALIDPDEEGSYNKYIEGFKGDYSDSYELGSAVHATTLQPEFFNISDIRKPTGKLGVFAEKLYDLRQTGLNIQDAINEASKQANYYSGKLTNNRLKTAIKSCIPFYLQRIHSVEELDKKTLFLSPPIALKYEKCLIGLDNNPEVARTLHPEGFIQNPEVYNEYAILCEILVTTNNVQTKVKFKAKLDNFTIDHENEILTLNDLKTSGKPVSYFMGNQVTITNEEGNISKVWYNGSFQKYHYYRQMAVYGFLLSCAVKKLFNLSYKLKANMVVVETIPDFSSRVYKVHNKDIKRGLNEFKKLLILIADEQYRSGQCGL